MLEVVLGVELGVVPVVLEVVGGSIEAGKEHVWIGRYPTGEVAGSTFIYLSPG